MPGRRNVFTTTADFTGIAFLTETAGFATDFPACVSRPRRTEAEWDFDYDIQKGRINSSTALVNYHIGDFTIGGGDAYSAAAGRKISTEQLPRQSRFNQFRLLLGYGYPNKRGFSCGHQSAASTRTLDSCNISTVQTSYNWDCCGVEP